MKTTTKNKNNVTQILGNDISWWVNANSIKELDSSTIEHIEYSIQQGYSSGQIVMTYGKNYNKETAGWWNIIDWESIALEFYNCTVDIKGELPKSFIHAKKMFDENWG